MIEIYRKNIVGCKEADIKRVAKKVMELNSQRVYIFSKGLIEELRTEYHLLVISGSPIEIVGEYAREFEFDDFFGSIYKKDKNGFYTGEEEFFPAKDKGTIVRDFAQKKNISLKDSVGVGDTESDAKFLELVDRPIAFNPNKGLKAIAEFEDWEIMVERKDVIYQIN